MLNTRLLVQKREKYINRYANLANKYSIAWPTMETGTYLMRIKIKIG